MAKNADKSFRLVLPQFWQIVTPADNFYYHRRHYQQLIIVLPSPLDQKSTANLIFLFRRSCFCGGQKMSRGYHISGTATEDLFPENKEGWVET